MTSIREKLLGRFEKEEVSELINRDRALFHEVLKYATGDEEPLGWRAAWVLFHAMEEKDERLQSHLPKIVMAIKGKPDGHQRELLRIIGKLHIPEQYEGILFDCCMNIWEETGKIPSVRLFAFRILFGIARKYPELRSEISFLIQSHYTETLSPGIRNSVERMTF